MTSSGMLIVLHENVHIYHYTTSYNYVTLNTQGNK